MASPAVKDHLKMKTGRISSSSSSPSSSLSSSPCSRLYRCWRSPLLWFYTLPLWKSRLLLGLGLLTFVIFVSRPYQNQPNPLLVSGQNRYTVVINTWKRYDLLRKTVAHYALCRGVDAVRVVWSESQPPPGPLLAALEASVRGAAVRNKNRNLELRIDANEQDDLNNRFKPVAGIATDAVFSIDDDVLVPCTALEFAFRVWLSAPDSMVGFVPRMHWPQQSTSKEEKWRQISPTFLRRHHPKFAYGGWWSVWWMGTYSMVLSKAAFLHHKYLEYYTYEMPDAIRRYVASQRNCEDIAMSFMVANLTNAPPVWVQGKLYEIGSRGISSLKSHSLRRTACLNFLADRYGYMPLVSSNVKAVDAKNMNWFW